MSGGARPRAGRKSVKIDSLELEKLCSFHCTDQEIASILGISVRTLERRKKKPVFAETMERGRAKGRVSVRRMLFTQAAKGNVAATIFLAKNHCGYRDVLRNEHSGPDGGAIQFEDCIDLSQLSDEEIEQLRAIGEKAKREREK